LVTDYSDIICLFASDINNKELTTIVLDQLRYLLIEGGAGNSWSEIIE